MSSPSQDQIFSHKHPKEMYLLALTEMCQRFAYWGIAYLLVLYLVKYFSYPESSANKIFGTYTGLAFILPVLGGYIADKWNYTKPILLGSLLTAAGALLLSTLQEWAIFPALALVGLGGGLFTPSIYSLLGRVYTKSHTLREGGFTIFYAAVNIGVFLAMIISGYLQTIDWRLVFIVSAVVALLGIIPYTLVVKRLKNKERSLPSHHHQKESLHYLVTKKHERDRIIVILFLTLASVLFWMAFNQAGSSMALFASNYTDRNVLGFLVPAPWFLSIEPLFLTLLAFPLTLLYFFLRKIKSSASPAMKTALSLFFMGLCFLIMQRASVNIPVGAASASESPFYLIFAFILMSLAELFLAPIGLSLVTNLSPHRYRGLLTGVWFTCIGLGFFLGGYLASFMQDFSLSTFFSIFVFSSFVPALILMFSAKKLDKMRHIDYL